MRILLALCCALLGGAESLANALPVVDTWSALARREPTLLPDGTPVRIGIQTLSGPVGSGIAVYVLAPAQAPLAFSGRDRTCGPVLVRHTHPDLPVDLRAQAMICTALQTGDDALLYANIVPLAWDGAHTITVLTVGGQALATATVTASDAGYHTWGTLWEHRLPQAALAEGDSIDCYRLDITALIQPGKPVVVAAGCFEPWTWRSQAWLTDVLTGAIPDQALPTSEPTQASPELPARIQGEVITVHLPRGWVKIPGSHFASTTILTRWWRNGKPWQQEGGIADVPQISFDGGLHAIMDEPLPVRIHLDPETLPKGERIEIQLLFSRSGWQDLYPGLKEEALADAFASLSDDSPPEPVLITPRLMVADPHGDADGVP